MKEVRWYCDVCGEEIRGTVYEIDAGWDEEVDEMDPGITTRESMELGDVCKHCLMNLSDLFTGRMKILDIMPKSEPPKPAPAKKETATPKDPPKPKPEKKKRAPRVQLDLGKIAALHNAGWSNAKIADEMHTSAVTIGKHLPEALEYLNNRDEYIAAEVERGMEMDTEED